MYFVPTREPGGPTVLRGDSIFWLKMKIEVFFVFYKGLVVFSQKRNKNKV